MNVWFDRSLGIDERGGGWGWSAFAGPQGGVFGSAPISLNTWTFVAVVYDQTTSTVMLYIDGNTYTKDDVILEEGTETLHIGSNPKYGEYFSGTIDEVFIFNKVLTHFHEPSLTHEKH